MSRYTNNARTAAPIEIKTNNSNLILNLNPIKPIKNEQTTMNKNGKSVFERTTNETWDSYDIENMKSWYDGTIDGTAVPFIPLGSDYYVPTMQSSARPNALDGTLAYHHQCYNITDGSNKYFLDGYDEILEANGFHKYVPNYDLSNLEEKSAFHDTEESKYVNCFINQEKNIAIKYYFDINNGNTIRVFKLSEMKSWLTD